MTEDEPQPGVKQVCGFLSKDGTFFHSEREAVRYNAACELEKIVGPIPTQAILENLAAVHHVLDCYAARAGVEGLIQMQELDNEV